MQYRRLGKTGWNVSAISLGCWGIGGQWGPVAEDEALRTMQAAIDAGINLFDTADAYGPSTSEELVGKALEGAARTSTSRPRWATSGGASTPPWRTTRRTTSTSAATPAWGG